VVAPNVDTLYSIAHLDLSRGLVVLSHPDMGHRYFVFELLDPYTNVIGYIGSRTTGSAGGRFAISWTGHAEPRIRGTRVITFRYRSVWVIGRTLAGDCADQRRAVALMRRYTLTSPGGPRTFGRGCRPGRPVSARVPTGLAFLDALSSALTRYPPPARDAALLGDLRRVGVGPGREPQHAGLTPTVLSALIGGVTQEAGSLLNTAEAQVLDRAVHHGGWYAPPANTDAYGTDYLTRAEIATVGLGANTPAEATYPIALTDSTGQLLNGATGSYELVFLPRSHAAGAGILVAHHVQRERLPGSQHRSPLRSRLQPSPLAPPAQRQRHRHPLPHPAHPGRRQLAPRPSRALPAQPTALLAPRQRTERPLAATADHPTPRVMTPTPLAVSSLTWPARRECHRFYRGRMCALACIC
jgi:hypothetical protein